MYPPKLYNETDQALLIDFIRSIGAGTLVALLDGEFQATHLPMLIKEEMGRLSIAAHIQRDNPLSRTSGQKCMFLFHGPSFYIRPGWNERKRLDGRVEPTLNYSMAQAHGVVRIIDDPSWLLNHVTELTAEKEAGLEEPWAATDAPEGFVENRLRGVLGIHFEITDLRGVFKLSQYQPAQNRANIIQSLRKCDAPNAAAVVALMEGAGSSPV